MFPRSPWTRNRPGLHIGEHLFIDPLCSTAEGKFTQCIKVPLIEELLDRPCCHIRDIDFPVPQPLEKFRGGKIDNLDLDASSITRSGTVSRTSTPVIWATTSLRLSICWTFSVV